MPYHISRIFDDDRYSRDQWTRLLQSEDIAPDRHLDYTCGLYDEEENLVATGSFLGNTLRCLAVSKLHQGENLLPLVVGHLSDLLAQRGVYELFVYAKYESAKFFASIGFFEICKVDNTLVFMERRKNGFSYYLSSLAEAASPMDRNAAIVLNANPFTLGHLYLVETAAAQTEQLHLFVVSEDLSLVPAEDRFALVQAGTNYLNNVVLHKTGSYLISQATFPSYFLKEERAVILAQAKLDTEIFKRIAAALHIRTRFLGEEPFSLVTAIYNEVMMAQLHQAGIDCVVLPRKTQDGVAISASAVRSHIAKGQLENIRPLVPESTYRYFCTERGQQIIKKIQSSKDVIHY